MSPLTPDLFCAPTIRAQFGLINRAQARAAGISDRVISWRLKTERWSRFLPRVFLAAPVDVDGRSWLMGAYLWAGEGSAISGSSAAYLWGLRGFSPLPVHISLPRNAKSPDERIKVHQVQSPLASEITFLGAIAVTSVRLTLLDLAAAGHRRVEAALDQSLHDGLVTVSQMWLMLDKPWALGRRGIRTIRDLLIERTKDRAPTHSDLELLLKRIVARGALPQPTRQHPVKVQGRIVHLDFAYPDLRLCIETDGYAWHMDRAAFENDRKRDAELQAIGWRVLRFTWAQMRYEPEYVLEQLRVHLGGWDLAAART